MTDRLSSAIFSVSSNIDTNEQVFLSILSKNILNQILYYNADY